MYACMTNLHTAGAIMDRAASKILDRGGGGENWANEKCRGGVKYPPHPPSMQP